MGTSGVRRVARRALGRIPDGRSPVSLVRVAVGWPAHSAQGPTDAESRQRKSSRRAAEDHPPDAKVPIDGRCGVGPPLRALRHPGHCPAPPRPGPRWLRATVGDRFLGCGWMRFLPPFAHQDVGGYEEVFEVHAQSTAFRSGSCRGGNGERAGSGPATLTSSWMAPLRVVLAAACAGPLVWAGTRPIRPGAPRPDAGASCQDPISSRTGATIRPGTVHETSPNNSAATASRRNAAAGPIE